MILCFQNVFRNIGAGLGATAGTQIRQKIENESSTVDNKEPQQAEAEHSPLIPLSASQTMRKLANAGNTSTTSDNNTLSVRRLRGQLVQEQVAISKFLDSEQLGQINSERIKAKRENREIDLSHLGESKGGYAGYTYLSNKVSTFFKSWMNYKSQNDPEKNILLAAPENALNGFFTTANMDTAKKMGLAFVEWKNYAETTLHMAKQAGRNQLKPEEADQLKKLEEQYVQLKNELVQDRKDTATKTVIVGSALGAFAAPAILGAGAALSVTGGMIAAGTGAAVPTLIIRKLDDGELSNMDLLETGGNAIGGAAGYGAGSALVASKFVQLPLEMGKKFLGENLAKIVTTDALEGGAILVENGLMQQLISKLPVEYLKKLTQEEIQVLTQQGIVKVVDGTVKLAEGAVIDTISDATSNGVATYVSTGGDINATVDGTVIAAKASLQATMESPILPRGIKKTGRALSEATTRADASVTSSQSPTT